MRDAHVVSAHCCACTSATPHVHAFAALQRFPSARIRSLCARAHAPSARTWPSPTHPQYTKSPAQYVQQDRIRERAMDMALDALATRWRASGVVRMLGGAEGCMDEVGMPESIRPRMLRIYKTSTVPVSPDFNPHWELAFPHMRL